MLAGAALLIHLYGAPVAKAPELPVAPVTLKVAPQGATWKLTIENGGELPVRIPADARLFSFELTPAATDGAVKTRKPAVVKCTLPDDARPSNDEGSELVIPPARSWSATIDPLFYCFGGRAALAAGTTVKARFGFAGKPAAAPFAVNPVGAAVGKLAPAKTVEAAPFTLGDAPAPAAAASASDDASEAVTLTVPETSDAARGFELGTVVSLRNTGERAITLLYRPELVQLRVSGPSGDVACGHRKDVASPIRELFSTVAPKGRLDLGVLITAVCPAGTFDEPGVYRITPRLDTSGASGAPLGIRSWDGVATAKTPMLLRVRNRRRPLATPARPALD